MRTTKKAVACVNAARKPIELVSFVNFLHIGYYIEISPAIASFSSTAYTASGSLRLSSLQKHANAPFREIISLKFDDKLSIFCHWISSL